jgi:hypothetical protein
MPKRIINGREYIWCVNQPGPPPDGREDYPALIAQEWAKAQGPIHMMTPLAAWAAVNAVNAPLAPNLPARPTHAMVPLRMYACEACGYVEWYLGSVVAPEIWRHG